MIRTFFVPGQPQGKGRAKVTTRGKYAHAYTPEKTVAYENLVKMEYEREHGGEPFMGGELFVTIRARFQIPKSASKKRACMMRLQQIRPTSKPDWDNIGKVICDSLNGVAWADDSQVVEAMVLKVYDDMPGVIVEILDRQKEATTNG